VIYMMKLVSVISKKKIILKFRKVYFDPHVIRPYRYNFW
jgi:hypothetical protein